MNSMLSLCELTLYIADYRLKKEDLMNSGADFGCHWSSNISMNRDGHLVEIKIGKEKFKTKKLCHITKLFEIRSNG
jgi:hypothetical protein